MKALLVVATQYPLKQQPFGRLGIAAAGADVGADAAGSVLIG